MHPLQIVGRRSSLFTRMPLIVAEELDVHYEFVPIHDMTLLGPAVYAGNPALKLPILRTGDAVLFGAANICRAIAERSASGNKIVWPEELREDVSRNAQELVWHCMATQVQIVMGTTVNKLPAGNGYFVKAMTSLEASLRWLDVNLDAALKQVPKGKLSLFEVSLHCLIEHLAFRRTADAEPFAALMQFSQVFSLRPAAQRTVYRFDTGAVS